MTLIFNRITEKTKRRELRANLTNAEKVMWAVLKNKQFQGIKFRRQYSIGPYIADFYSPELKLVIEIDGGIHETKAAAAYDKYRSDYIRSLGLKVIRFTNNQVLKRMDVVMAELNEAVAEIYTGE